MATVQSFGTLTSTTAVAPWIGDAGQPAVPLYGSTQSLAHLYASQPNVRTCVDFLARNVAHLAPHAFRRLSDTDRVRLHDHDVIRWLNRPTPNPALTRYRLIENLVGDLALYFNAYWLKVPWLDPTDGRPAIGLLRLPPAEVEIEGGVLPTRFRWTRYGTVNEYTPEQICHFNGYSPLANLKGLSPLYTLRRLLAEEQAAGAYREAFWRNAGRFEGLIERPAGAPKWNKEQRAEWRQQWQERYAGGAGAGMTAVLEDGMTYKPTSFSAKDSEFIDARKLSQTLCASAWHIPPPFVGDLEHATFSNIREQHKNLYQDTLGPWLEMIELGIQSQLLIESTDARDVYLEFNIAAKLAGSFEEQAAALHALVGRPIMTANEGRARLNLPRDDDPSSDQIAPQQGGPASTVQVEAPLDQTTAAAGVARVLADTTRRQRQKLGGTPVGDRAAALAASQARWTRELTADLAPFLRPEEAARTAAAHHDRLLAALHREAIHDW